jgi:hypothetical protein
MGAASTASIGSNGSNRSRACVGMANRMEAGPVITGGGAPGLPIT